MNSAKSEQRADVAVDLTTEADAWTLLDKLAAIARRASRGGLPSEMAQKLDALAEAARTHGPVIEHPSWCDRGDACLSDMEWDEGVLSVYHETTLFEMYEGDTKFNSGHRWYVQLLQAENYMPDGTVMRDAVRLYVDVPPNNDGLHGVQLERFARAVALGGHLATGSPPASPNHPDVAHCGCETCSPDEVFEVVPRRVFHFVGDPNGPGARGYAGPD